jgi:hypothetical protein
MAQKLEIPDSYDQEDLLRALAALGIVDVSRVSKVVLKPSVLEVTVLIPRGPERKPRPQAEAEQSAEENIPAEKK